MHSEIGSQFLFVTLLWISAALHDEQSRTIEMLAGIVILGGAADRGVESVFQLGQQHFISHHMVAPLGAVQLGDCGDSMHHLLGVRPGLADPAVPGRCAAW